MLLASIRHISNFDASTSRSLGWQKNRRYEVQHASKAAFIDFSKNAEKVKNCPTVQLEKRWISVNAHAGFHKGHKVEEYRALEAAKFSSRLCLYKPVTAPLNTTKVIFFSVGVS